MVAVVAHVVEAHAAVTLFGDEQRFYVEGLRGRVAGSLVGAAVDFAGHFLDGGTGTDMDVE